MFYLLDSVFLTKCAQYAEDWLKVDNALLLSFWLSILILGVVYVVKYFISKTPELANRYYAAMLDFPNELFIVLIPIIVAGSIQHNEAGLGFVLVLIAFLLSSITLWIRSNCINSFYKNRWWFFAHSFFLYFFSLSFTLIVYSLIQSSWK